MHLFIYGLILGWGASIPIGPINLEMMRRNIQFGTSNGVSLGLGACAADLTYVVLLCIGALSVLDYPVVLNTVGILGAVILCWFGYKAFMMPVNSNNANAKRHSITKSLSQGYMLTLINPFTILFWLSVSAQLLIVTKGSELQIILAALGVMVGTISWVFAYNAVLHHTRHKLSEKMVHLLNRTGGVILFLFAGYSVFHVVKGF